MDTKAELKAIPQPPGKPVIGNMLTVNSEKPLQSLMGITREQGPIFKLDMMGTPLVVVSGNDLVDELCDEARFDKAVRGALRRVRAIGGDGLFTGETQEENWPKAHRILLPTFAQRAMVNYFPMMVDIADQLVMKWERLNADDEIDVVHDMTALALDTIGVCGFDYRFNSFYRRDYHPFIDALNRTLETCMLQRGLPFEGVVLRKRLDQLKQDVGYMNNLVDEIIRERRKGGAEAQTQKDLLNYMLSGVDRVTGESLSDENIRYQINTFLIAGHETTSGLMSFTLYFLLNNPDVLERAYEEVDRVLGKDIASAPTLQQVNQLTYIQQILKEALRLWPTAPAFSVYPYEDEVIGGQYKLKKRTFTTILTLMLHRDKSVWGDNAEEFDPENFSREAEAARPFNAYKPFGNGQRACIGRQFAMQEATLVMGMLLQRFELIDHTNYTLKVKETMSIKPDGFRIKVKLRDGLTRSALVPGAAADESPDTLAAVAKRPSHGTPLLVLYGSNLGTTEDFAADIANAAEVNGFETTLAELDDFAGKLPSNGAVIIASPSYNGAPPDNAVKFVDWLEHAEAGALDGVTYAIFGSGNRDWASTFQVIPRKIDERMQALGAKRAGERGEGDALEDIDGQFRDWLGNLWPKIAEALDLDIDITSSADSAPLYDVKVIDTPTRSADASDRFETMTVLENRELQMPALSGRSTRHVEVGLPEGTVYRPGDHLSIQPINSDRLANRALTHFGFAPDTQIVVHATGGRRSPHGLDGPVSAGRLMKTMVDLQAVATRKQVQALAVHTECPKSRPELEALGAEPAGSKDLYRSEIFLKRVSVMDLLQRFPACQLPFNIFLEMMPSLAPRYYSISSSPKKERNVCSITVGIVSGPARSGNGTYRGICSNYVANLDQGNTFRGAIKETKAGFRLPEDASVPVIMIGPGTGLAPFRGFLQEREALKKDGERLGPAMLFFGCRHPDQDFIYRDELEAWDKEGLVDLIVAFSRVDDGKAYVQDKVREHGARVLDLIEKGAHVYICGDGSRMEPDVKRALVTLYCEAKDVDPADGDLWMEQLIANDRYNLDVWAG